MSEGSALLDRVPRARLQAEAFPAQPEPVLATLTHDPFDDPGWVYERKLDGQRLLLLRHGGRVRLRSRNGESLDATYPEVVEAAESASAADLVADGEVVAFDGPTTSFARLQGRMGIHDPERARRSPVAVRAYLFDLLHLDGYSTRALALRDRKRLLRQVIAFGDPLRFSAHRNGDGISYLAKACARGWEGLIAKDATSTYTGGRSRSWLKLKCENRQELVIGGYTDPRGARQGFGALLVGYHSGERLRYAGKVGTGYDAATLRDLGDRLARIERTTSPFADPVRGRDVHFVEPELVAEVTFTEWTRDGMLRHPSYVGLRDDKDPREVVREGEGG